MSEWDISGSGDSSIQGFATDISVNQGDTVRFKVKTNASSYRLDIYRIGYYGGLGARKIATVNPSATLPQSQPACIDDPSTTGLLDCGNWAQSASWPVPASAVSGVYIARLVRGDTGGASHIIFVVRDDAGSSALLFQTADTTWQAYNDWGDKPTNARSMYESPNGRAVKVSYNRPFNTRGGTPGGRDFFFANEYPMVRWIEANGYDVSYTTGVDSDRRGALIKQHKALLSVGHDEYWSAAQRANVEAARDAGVSAAFFSGNSVYWKTRWEPSVDASASPYRTLVSYKETKAGAKVDPNPAWTGTWRDPRFSPPADGGRPENALMGTLYKVNTGEFAIEVPSEDGKMRLWRNTSVASLAPGTTAVLSANTLGYEWDEDEDNGFRPGGLIRLSSTTKDVSEYLYDYGTSVGPGRATHHLTLYRAPSGALVFGGGTIQWSWGLDGDHDGTVSTPDVRMRQATVNLFADMGVQPASLQSGLVAASKSTDATAPTAVISTPASGATVNNGAPLTVSGTATDVGGRVGGVEVSLDGGSTWHPASGRETWTYSGAATGSGPTSVKARATDDSGNIQGTPASVPVTVNCPCKIFADASVPKSPSATDTGSIELGVKFRARVDAWATGVRFYKGANNTGIHTGTLWSATGTRLATATFVNETAGGWQLVSFAEPVPISANTTYVASYLAPKGGYAADGGAFQVGPVDSPPLQALKNGTDGGNGVYLYGGGFPTNSYGAANYWVDVVVTTTPPPDSQPPAVAGQSPGPGVSSVSPATTVTATFSEPVQASTVSFVLKDQANAAIAASVAYDAPSRTATLTPATALAGGTTFTATVSGVKDLAGNAMAAPVSWSFKTAVPTRPPGSCPCSIWNDSTVPSVAASSDATTTELGVKFRADKDGFIDGIRFYKGPGNTGTHTGTLWSAAGASLATVTFANESTQGWQEALFATPVAVTAGTTYVASYLAPNGRYAVTSGQFSSAGVTYGPLTALGQGVDGANGVYVYGGGFPRGSYGAANYWVDVVFSSPPDTTPPAIASSEPGPAATSVPVGAGVRATFTEAVAPSTINFTVRDGAGATVAGALSYDAAARTATFAPAAPLVAAARYTASLSGAADPAGNVMAPVTWTFTTAGVGACPCTIWSSSAVPGSPSTKDPNPYELGVKFRSDVAGYVTGVRFYKGAGNTGPHTGKLWSAAGALLASADFAGETASGWQQVTFSQPVAITAGTTYVASYQTTTGFYASDAGYFSAAGSENPPLRALATGADGGNGVYASGSGFPTQTYGAANYWVDPIFTDVDRYPPTVVSTGPADGATSVPVNGAATATFSEPLKPGSVSFVLADPAGVAVPATVNYDATTRTATLRPNAALAWKTRYTATVSGAADLAGNVMAPVAWSFTTATAPPPAGTCPCSIWNDTVAPVTTATDDTSAVEVGVKFRTDSDGWIYGIRFFKGVGNGGTHTGSLWSATGARLALVTFTNESTSGWQQAMFSTPVAVKAGTTYVASYFAPAGRYAADGNYFTSGTATPPVRALANGSDGGNGVYRYGPSSFPDQTAGPTNYWVDVVFDRTP